MERQKVDKAIYRCEGCSCECYFGRSPDAYEKHKLKYPDVKFGLDLDHITPVVDIKKGMGSWDEFIIGLFCPAEDLQVLCKECHSAKTQEENKQRVEARASRKKK